MGRSSPRRRRYLVVCLILTLLGASTGCGTPRADVARTTHVSTENQLVGTESWRIATEASDGDLAGYATRSSLLPGEAIQLKVHSRGTSVATDVFRVGDYQGLGGRLIAQLPARPAVAQPPCAVSELHMVDCSTWTVTHTIPTAGFPPGFYLIKLRDDKGREKYIPVLVRTSDARGKAVLISSTATAQAYNRYGGTSLYDGADSSYALRARQVSFDRPYAGTGATIFESFELATIRQAEAAGVDLGYTDSYTLEAAPHELAGAAALVLLGHDEYWSPAMRRTVQDAVDGGTNLAVLGANSLWWRIRWTEGGRSFYGFKEAREDPVQGPATTTHFVSEPAPDPEARLSGTAYDGIFPDGKQRDMEILEPGFFLLSGVPHGALHVPALVGSEFDRVVRGRAPANVCVVAHSPVETQNRSTFADMSYYTAPSGAGVFAVGTTGWNWALDPELGPLHGIPAETAGFARRVTTNVMTEFVIGPAGARHPSCANLDRIYPPDDPASNRTPMPAPTPFYYTPTLPPQAARSAASP